jgi:hypothetical protein
MQNHRPTSLALQHRHLTLLSVMYGPADHQVAEPINHNKQIQLAFVSCKRGDIGNPFSLRLLRIEITPEQIL